MKERRLNPIPDCPLTAASAAFGGKWKLLAIYWLAAQPRHFSGLRKLMPDISHKVLAEQLGELIADGIVLRHCSGPPPEPVLYELSEYGSTLVPLVEAIRQWGHGHIERCAEATAAE